MSFRCSQQNRQTATVVRSNSDLNSSEDIHCAHWKCIYRVTYVIETGRSLLIIKYWLNPAWSIANNIDYNVSSICCNLKHLVLNIWNVKVCFGYFRLADMAYETQLHLIGERIQEVTVEIVLTECFFSPVVWTIRDEVTSFTANDIFGTTSIWSVAIECKILKNVKTNKSI